MRGPLRAMLRSNYGPVSSCETREGEPHLSSVMVDGPSNSMVMSVKLIELQRGYRRVDKRHSFGIADVSLHARPNSISASVLASCTQRIPGRHDILHPPTTPPVLRTDVQFSYCSRTLYTLSRLKQISACVLCVAPTYTYTPCTQLSRAPWWLSY
jgi:hypothetical protein